MSALAVVIREERATNSKTVAELRVTIEALVRRVEQLEQHAA